MFVINLLPVDETMARISTRHRQTTRRPQMKLLLMCYWEMEEGRKAQEEEDEGEVINERR